MSETPVHDWIAPRLQKLVDEAIGAGFDPLTVTAVITDIIASGNLDHQGAVDLGLPDEQPARSGDEVRDSAQGQPG